MKKLILMAMSAVMSIAMAIPAMAAEVGARADVQVYNAGFHCNTYSGNGRVWVDNYVDGEWHEFEYAGDTNWALLSEDYVCPACGSNEWVSYSNNSSVPNGKNIQLNHPGVSDTDPEPELSGINISQNVTVTTINTKIIEKWQGEMTPFQTITQFVSEKFDSTTLSNAGAPKVVNNSNHFCYAILSKAALANGSIELELFNGNKLNVVGKAKASLVDGQIVVEFENELMSITKYGIVAFDGFLPVVKNGNIHSVNIFKTGTGSAVTPYALNSFQSSDKKGANYDKDWAEITKGAIKNADNIYLYMHANPIQYNLGTEKSEIELKVTKEPVVVWSKTVETPVGPVQEFIEVKVFDSEGNEIDEIEWSDLEPGFYTVVFYDTYLGEEVTEEVEVVYGETITVVYNASYDLEGETTTKRIDLPFIENELVTINKTVTVK